MMQKLDVAFLEDLAARLAVFKTQDTDTAIQQIRAVLPNKIPKELEESREFLGRVWFNVSCAVERGEFDSTLRYDLITLESAIGGYVYEYRLAEGWLHPATWTDSTTKRKSVGGRIALAIIIPAFFTSVFSMIFSKA